MGALVGSGAPVIGLDSMIRTFIGNHYGIPADEVGAQHPTVLATVTVGILGLSFLATYWLIRRAERSIATRLEGRRQPMRRTIRSMRVAARSRVVR
ncbi:MAG: hypothetical protein GEV11_28735 [Streptosporangiales bacterium]|nr:hypothetical protein [Streptosporangiales bacterium]